ncbi:MAG: hypothetical protein J6N73_04000 [Prevotella sp.]|nr:hypothetical protein [Prevotella sp.]
MENPFKFGTIVEAEYFTDRVDEVNYICQFIQSPNHLILISPRRFGKSSVVAKAIGKSGRKCITINLQQVTSVADLSAKLMREFLKVHPLERIRHLITHFRIIPTISTNALTGSIDVSFQPGVDSSILLEDVMTLIEKTHSENNRIVVVLDEFQEILDLDPHLDKKLRAIMQTQKHVNYILLGSQESMMTEIFEKKKSPFYHFGQLMKLGKLPYDDFHEYLSKRLKTCFPDNHNKLADSILAYTGCHPYYTQQLASSVWQLGVLQPDVSDVIRVAIDTIVTTHGLDYERLWMNFKRTNKWILQRLALNSVLQTGEQRTSTIYSALKRLQKEGYIIYSERYEIEDPFFKEWIIKQANGS